MAHLIRRSGVTQEQANRLDKINSAGRHLLGIINAILDLSKIDSGKLILDESEVHLEALIRNVVSMLSDSAEEKHLKLLIESQWTAYPLIGDATRLQQALLNYVINAIKFTDSGNIILRTLIDDEDPESVLVRFEVQDSGIGITPEVSQRLFNPFEQATGLTKRRHGGTGLGLAITRRFAQLMGGEAGVESTPNVGSTFWFTARLKKNGVAGGASTHTSIDAEAVLKQRYSGLRILLVDDEPINREVAMGQLEDVGLLVETAVDGEEAVTMAQKNNFAVILMDMQMPKLNGLEATRLIRQLHGYRKIPIIAMTANAFTEDKTQCLMAGMNDFLSKPFMPEELFAILLRNLEHSTS
jgi:CheY-like chemotaxis protein